MLLFLIALSLVLVTALLLHLDDLFLDAFVFFKRLRPKVLSQKEEAQLLKIPQRRFAILIPNWKEEKLLSQIVSGNLSRLDYNFYSVFLGVYPNDLPSWQAARELEAKFPHAHVLVNRLPGPSSKAQLTNEMIAQILASEVETGIVHDAFLLQDAEDVLHPLTLALLNQEMEGADLVQLPLLSLPLSWKEFTAGAYADETAESYTRDLLARNALGASLPSIGAGLSISRTLLKTLLNKGPLLHEKHSAENYHLGIRAGQLGFQAKMVSAMRGKRDFIGTRKFFPTNTASAIRQKARWTAGIAFQGASRFGWRGNWADRYFLWRDRRGPWTTIFLSLASCLFLISALQSNGETPLLPPWMEALSIVNAVLLVRRILFRIRTTAWVHGWLYALLVPIRWPVVNFLNSLSTWRALALYRESEKSGMAPIWIPREKRLPEL